MKKKKRLLVNEGVEFLENGTVAGECIFRFGKDAGEEASDKRLRRQLRQAITDILASRNGTM